MGEAIERVALVKVRYTDSGPGLAGAYPGTVAMANVLEVTASSPDEAQRAAYDRIYKSGTAGGISTAFLRWL
jgi:hypothetical protein